MEKQVKDPNTPNADERKKIMFYETPSRLTKFKIRCQYDGINQSQFFRMMITGYIENNEGVLKYLDEYKEKYKIQGEAKRNKIMKTHSEARENRKKFNLADDEVESIYDIIEAERNL